MANELPKWAREPILRFLDYGEESHRLLHLSMRGISMLRAVPRIVEVLEKYPDPHETKDPQAMSVAEAHRMAELATTENERGFPLLHFHTLIGVWAAFEAAIEDLLVAFLVNQPEISRQDAFAKIRVPLSEFEVLEKDERMRFLISEFERNQGVARKHGVDRFEALLEPFGLGGDVGADVKKNIREMHMIRNVLVHRGGKADRRLVEGCPWLGLRLGEAVVVTHAKMAQYQESLVSYVTELLHRLRPKFGLDSGRDTPKEASAQ